MDFGLNLKIPGGPLVSPLLCFNCWCAACRR
jgi:hypothetical protein